MRFTPTELAQLAITFPQTHAVQISIKAARYDVPRDDASQEASSIIWEMGPVFDPAKGTFCQFVFGHLDKRLRRQLGAHTFAISLDGDDSLGEDTRSLIENLEAPAEYEEETARLSSDAFATTKALAIARFVSGKSSSDLARLLGVTPRRVRQMLQQLREEHVASNQFELCLEEVC